MHNQHLHKHVGIILVSDCYCPYAWRPWHGMLDYNSYDTVASHNQSPNTNGQDFVPLFISGTAYFVFGEYMNVFTTNDPTHKEFIEAGLEFIGQVSQLSPLPIYKYYHTKGYKAFVQATRRMRELGRCFR